MKKLVKKLLSKPLKRVYFFKIKHAKITSHFIRMSINRLEEPHGQRNPSEERKINEEAQKKREQEKHERGLQKLREFAEIMSHAP